MSLFILASPPRPAEAASCYSLDIDGDGKVSLDTDGMLVFRYLNGFSGDNLIRGLVLRGTRASSAPSITAYVENVRSRHLDIDLDGATSPFSDATVVMLYLAGHRGNDLVSRVALAGTRKDGASVTSYLNDIANPGRCGGSTPTPTPKPTAAPTPKPTATPTPKPTAAPTPKPTATPTPKPTTTPTPPPPAANTIKAWVNEGGDKVAQEDLRLSTKGASAVVNSVWNGSTVNLFGARNETVNFNVIIEAPERDLQSLQVTFDTLTGPGGARIGATAAAGDKLFDYRGRNIELFYVRYLQIRGLSRLGYETYDERHIPVRLRRPHSGHQGSGGWTSRPDHDKYYPDIAVPLEAVQTFNVKRGTNQSIWVDIYIPAAAAAGTYSGTLRITERGAPAKDLPVKLTVRNFALPNTPNSKTMLFIGDGDVNARYLGVQWPSSSTDQSKAQLIMNRHFQMAHRHRISLINNNDGWGSAGDRPTADWVNRLNGALFTPQQGYDGPGTGVGNNVYAISPYSFAIRNADGTWRNAWGDSAALRSHADNWVRWFDANSPQTEYFLYLFDEPANPADAAIANGWARTLNIHTGVGKRLMSLTTIPANYAQRDMPELDIPVSPKGLGVTQQWESLAASYRGKSDKRFWMYNGQRPMSGSFMTDDDGVALRELAWGQYKKNIQRWFYWESTYYNNYQAGGGQTNVFRQAQTFGSYSQRHPELGETGWNYSNGDGVLFYPGTERVYKEDSYGLNGPIASLRLKFWRRGIQDVDYLTMAARVAPAKVTAIVNRVLPKALWEYNVNDANDPTWVLTDVSWSPNPDVWEQARSELAAIIENGR